MQVATITQQINNKAELLNCCGGKSCGEDAGHTHPESFPTSAQHESEESMPPGPDWCNLAAVL